MFERHVTSLWDASRQLHTALQAVLETRDAQRLVAWTETLSATSEKFGQAWEKTDADTANRQQDICDTLT